MIYDTDLDPNPPLALRNEQEWIRSSGGSWQAVFVAKPTTLAYSPFSPSTVNGTCARCGDMVLRGIPAWPDDADSVFCSDCAPRFR